jgi:hypothetical protein
MTYAQWDLVGQVSLLIMGIFAGYVLTSAGYLLYIERLNRLKTEEIRNRLNE